MPIVHPWLSEDLLCAYARAFQLGEPNAIRHVPSGPINTIYALETRSGRFVLRILEGRSLGDIFVEQQLLGCLRQSGLRVPHMLVAPGKGAVISLAVKRHLNAFPELPGRQLPLFSLQASHIEAVGFCLGKIHAAARHFTGRPRPLLSRSHLLARLRHSRGNTALCAPFKNHAKEVAFLLAQSHPSSLPRSLPRGTLHGNPTPSAARFKDTNTVALGDFGGSYFGPLLLDISHALATWAFPMDLFSLEHAQALLRGYQRVRPLLPQEWQHMGQMLRQQLAIFGLHRFCQHELHHSTAYEDFRHFLRRLEQVLVFGDEKFGSILRRAPLISSAQLQKHSAVSAAILEP